MMVQWKTRMAVVRNTSEKAPPRTVSPSLQVLPLAGGRQAGMKDVSVQKELREKTDIQKVCSTPRET